MTRRILVARPAAQAGALGGLLAQRGLHAVPVPAVEIDRASTTAALDAMLMALDGAAWLVVTSANGAAALADRIAATGTTLPSETRVAAVGPATRMALTAAGIGVDHVPAEYRTVAIADGLGRVDGSRVVLARADSATSWLRHALRARGALVEEVVAYRTIEGPPSSRDAFKQALHAGVDGLAFTSGSTVRGLLRLASSAELRRARAIPAFCIGPPTADAARRGGFDVAVTAVTHTSLGLADAIATHFARKDP